MTNALLSGLQGKQNKTRTLNGAPTLKSTGSDVLNYFYHAPSSRGKDNSGIFADAFNEDNVLAVKAAFYTRDIRGGQGERETFRQALRWLYKNSPDTFNRVVELVPVYGRWDDVLEYTDNGTVVRMVSNQLRKDRFAENPSLLAKWMPMHNTKGKGPKAVANRALAVKWAKLLGMSEAKYRHFLVAIRAKLNMPETLMSAKRFSDINYEHVPSRASALLRKAFSRNDAERYVAYLAAVKKGEKKINASTLYPYELVQGYASVHMGSGYAPGVTRLTSVDDTIEALWKALDNLLGDEENAIGVVDVSSSMFSSPNGNKIIPIFVSVALGIYLAERIKGAFHNYFMTFSNQPNLIKLRNGTLKSKVNQVFNAGVAYNTNIQAVFDSLLRTAIENSVKESDMPKTIFIFSDMEFDHPQNGSVGTNYEVIRRKYRASGYTMPRLVFWNIDSKQTQTPVREDENGVILVSGASPSIMKNALTTTMTTPYDMMVEKLNSDRYAAIDEALK
jgi:hypothetical protein